MSSSPRFAVQHAADAGPGGLPWQALCLLALLLPAGTAQALSSACSALNAASGSTAFSGRWYASEFAAGEQVSFDFHDNGQDVTRSAITAEGISVRSRNLSSLYLGYRSDTGVEGRHSASVSPSQLSNQGLYVRVSTGNYISPVSITCSIASTPANTAPLSQDVSLSSLTASAGTLSPDFTPDEPRYRLQIGNAIDTLILRPVAAQSGASITVNGVAVASGSQSPAISLNDGSSAINLAVISADRSRSKTYTLEVIRAEAVPVASDVSTSVAANGANYFINLAISGQARAVTLPGNASHGFATVSGTSVSYTPNAGFTGTDSFTYSASNDSGSSGTATVTITVTPR